MRGTGAERPVRAMKSRKLAGAKGSRHPAYPDGQPRAREEPSSHAKSFRISKWVVWEAYTRVKANHGAAGVDAESVEMFEQDLKNNLYRIWNRMSSGTYFPPPVRTVGIPKKDGSERRLGIPTVADRIAQKAVVDVILTPLYEPDFLGFSYGFRPGRGAHDALDALAFGIERRKVNWIIDADIRAFFDRLSRDHLLRFLEHRIGDNRVLRLITKWLNAGVMEDGEWKDDLQGTPQGAVVSPILANVYLHYVFDLWFQKKWRARKATGDTIIVRYADDCAPRRRRREAEMAA